MKDDLLYQIKQISASMLNHRIRFPVLNPLRSLSFENTVTSVRLRATRKVIIYYDTSCNVLRESNTNIADPQPTGALLHILYFVYVHHEF